LIIHGTGDLQIPIVNAYDMFKRALSSGNSSLKDLENTGKISRTIIPNEAVIFKSSTPKITLVELEFGDHNNGKLSFSCVYIISVNPPLI
jgi:hypothetical protein